MKPNENYAKPHGPGEIRLVRTLLGPIERIWEYLTDPEKRSRWFAGGPMEQRAGGKLELVFQHDKIAPNETPPPEYEGCHHAPGWTMPGQVLRWEPPRVLSYSFDENSEVTFELTEQGKNVLLVLTHRARGNDIPSIPGYATGWHTHLDQLAAVLTDTARPPFWPMHSQLKAEYTQLLADVIKPQS